MFLQQTNHYVDMITTAGYVFSMLLVVTGFIDWLLKTDL